MSRVIVNGSYLPIRAFSDFICRKRKQCISNIGNSIIRNIVSESKMKQILESRQFIPVRSLKTPNTSCTKSIDLSIGSYNILAQYQLHNNAYLYTHCDNDVLDWSTRWLNLKNDLERLNCDVFCLQEVQCDHYHDDIEPVMNKLGYFGYLSPKTGMKKDGCAIFIKESKFDCENCQFETVTYHRDNLRVLRTDNVGQIALLALSDESLPKNTRLCVANTHLFFNPNHGEVKLGELCVLMSEMDRIAKFTPDHSDSSDYHPIILCGDFNSEPNSILYDFMTRGCLIMHGLLASNISGQNETSFWGKKTVKPLLSSELPPRIGISDNLITQSDPITGTGVLSHDFSLKSAYVYSTAEKPRLVTAFTNADTCAVDFIFYRTDDNQAKRSSTTPFIEHISYLELFTRNEFLNLGGIPNKFHGSDHIPLVAQFKLHF